MANFANPAFGLLGDAVGALALVVGDVNIDAGKLSAMADEGHGDDVLESAEIVGFATDEQGVHRGGRDGKLDDVIFQGGINGDIDTEEGQEVFQVFGGETNGLVFVHIILLFTVFEPTFFTLGSDVGDFGAARGLGFRRDNLAFLNAIEFADDFFVGSELHLVTTAC